MKKITLLLFLSLGFNLAYADCASSGMLFLPKQKEIALNSQFLIEGYAWSQETINSFKERTIFLESEKGELTELILIQTLKGVKELTQALFKPIKELQPNTTYFLKYSDQTEDEEREMMKYNKERKKSEKIHWKTTDKKT